MTERIGLEAVLEDRNFTSGMNRYMDGLSKMSSGTVDSASQISNQFDDLGKNVLRVTAAMGTAFVAATAAAATAIGGFLVSSIKDAAAMEAQLSTIASVLNKTGEAAIPVKEIFSDVIKELGLSPDLKVTSEEAAKAIELLARNGVFAGIAIDDLEEFAGDAARNVVLLSNATGADFGDAADIATDAMALFEIEASGMGTAIDKIVAVTTLSKIGIEDYALGLRQGGATANLMGLSLDEFNVAMIAVSEEMGSGRKSGTGLRNVFNKLIPTGNKAKGIMRDLGLIVGNNNLFFDEQTGSIKSLADIAGLLDQALFGTKETMVEVGGRTAQQNKDLTDLQGAYRKAEKTIRDYELGIRGTTLADDKRNEKIQEQVEIMGVLGPKIEELTGIRGEQISQLNTLTDKERAEAVKLLFGAGAANAAIGLAKEGKAGIEALSLAMADVSAANAAQERMDNLAGSVEILDGIFETLKLNIGSEFLPVLNDLTKELTLLFASVVPKVEAAFKKLSDAFTDAVAVIKEGGTPLEAFGVALGDLGVPQQVILSIQDMITRIERVSLVISDFVVAHAPAFEGAFKAIAAFLASAGIKALIAGIIIAIKALMTSIFPLIALVGLVGAAWAENWFGIRDAIEPVINNVILPLLERVGKAVSRFLEVLTREGGNIKDALLIGFVTLFGVKPVVEFMGSMKGIVDTVKGVADALEGLFAIFGGNFDIEGIGDIFEGLGNIGIPTDIIISLIKFADGLGDIATTISNAFGTITNALGFFIDEIASAFGEGGVGAAIARFKELWPDVSFVIGVALGNALDALSEFGALLWATIQPHLQPFFDDLKAWFDGIDWGQLALTIITKIGDTWRTVGSLLGTAAGLLMQLVIDTINAIDWVAVGSALITAIATGLALGALLVLNQLNSLWNLIVGFITSQDWVQLGKDAIDALLSAFSDIGSGIGTTLQNLITNIRAWFEAQDWGEIGTSAISAIFEAFGNLGSGAGNLIGDVIKLMNSLRNAVTKWIKAQNWSKIGATIFTTLLTGLQAAIGGMGIVLGALWSFISEFMASQDWLQIGLDTIISIVEGTLAFGDALRETLDGFWQAFVDWVASVDWLGLGITIVTFIGEGLVSFITTLGETLGTWATAFTDWIASVDWIGLGQTIVDAALEWFDKIVLNTPLKLLEWFTSIVDWIASIDWAGVGTTIVDFITDGLGTLIAKGLELLTNWLTSITDWIASIDWYTIGFNITTFIIDGLLSLWEFITVTLPEWFTSIQTWFEGIDWGLLAVLLIAKLVLGLAQFATDVSTTLDEWWTSFSTWFEEQDWEQLSIDAIDAISEAIENFADAISETLSGWWTAFTDWFDEQDWGSLSGKIIDGIVTGITNGIETVKQAVRDLGSGILAGFNEEMDSNSPSRVMETAGGEVVAGLLLGIASGEITTESLSAPFLAWKDILATEVITPLVELFTSMWATIQATFMTAGSAISETITAISTAISEGLLGAISGLSEAGEGIWIGITDGLMGVEALFIEGMQLILQSVIATLPIIQQAFSDAWMVIEVVFESIRAFIVDMLLPTIELLAITFVEIVLAQIQQAFIDVWAIIQPIFMGLISLIVEMLIPTIQELLIQWMVVWTGIQTSLLEASIQAISVFTLITTWIQTNLVPTLIDLHDIWVNRVWLPIRANMKFVWGKVEIIFKLIQDWLETKFPGILATFVGVWNARFGALQSAVIAVKNIAIEFFDAVRSFASWLTGQVFKIDIQIPDLPGWMIPGSPLPLHTAWKNFADFLQGSDFDIGGMLNLGSSLATLQQSFETRTSPLESRLAEINELLAEGRELGNLDLSGFIILENERLDIVKQIGDEEERIAKIKEQQDQLSFLQDQLKLLELLEEAGLNPSEVLGGIELGLNADVNTLSDAMSLALDAIIQQTANSLTQVTGVASTAPAPVVNVQTDGSSHTNVMNIESNQGAMSLAEEFRLMDSVNV